MRDAFTRVLFDMAATDPNLTLVTADLGFGVLKPFWETYPAQFYNVGISEQAMISLCTGMAMEGKTVVAYSIGNFPTLRCLEQIRNCAAYHDANVKIVCIGGGFVYGSLGMTHHATEDMAALRCLPNVRVYAPADAREVEAVMPGFIREAGTAYLRLGRGGEPLFHDAPIAGYRTGDALTIRDGGETPDAAILTAGGILKSAVDAADALAQKGVRVRVASFPTVKPLDEAYLAALAKRVPLIVTLEEHTIVGGFGGAVAECVAGLSGANRPRVLRLGMRDVYSSIVGNQQYLLSRFGLDGAGVAASVLDAMAERADG